MVSQPKRPILGGGQYDKSAHGGHGKGQKLLHGSAGAGSNINVIATETNATFGIMLNDVPGTNDTFNITFMLDEKMQSWIDLHNWFRAIASPVSTAERNLLNNIQNAQTATKLPAYSDATLTILSNLNNPLLRLNMINMFPISLSDVQFSTQNSADDIMTADASFIFMYHEIVTA